MICVSEKVLQGSIFQKIFVDRNIIATYNDDDKFYSCTWYTFGNVVAICNDVQETDTGAICDSNIEEKANGKKFSENIIS